MNIEKTQVNVRTKFVGVVSLFVGFVSALGLHFTIGIWAPLLVLGIYCLKSRKREFLGLIPLKVYRAIYLSLAIVGITVHMVFGVNIAISFYVGSIIVIMTEPRVQKMLQWLPPL